MGSCMLIVFLGRQMNNIPVVQIADTETRLLAAEQLNESLLWVLLAQNGQMNPNAKETWMSESINSVTRNKEPMY